MSLSPPITLAGTPRPGRDLSLFKFVSEVDFIEVRVEVGRATNFWSIKALLKLNYAKLLEPSLSGAGTRFHVRVDDPGSWRTLAGLMATLEAEYGLATPPVVTKIEVAVDAYHRDEDHDALVAMAANFFRMGHHCSDNTRLNKGKGHRILGPSQMSPEHTVIKLRAGSVINIGNASDPVSQRIYVKATDQSGKAALPKHAHRARIEVTLSGVQCPIAELSAWIGFRFETLSPWFRFRRTSNRLGDVPLVNLVVFNRAPAPGSRGERPGRVLYDPRTDADTVLNRRAYDALRGLTKKMRA